MTMVASRAGSFFLVAAFAVSLATPATLAVFAPLSALLPNTPQEPVPTAPWMRSFPKRFERFFESHLGGRGALVTMHHTVEYFALQASPTDAVVVGREGWAFLNQDFMPESLAGGAFPSGELDQWVGTFKATQTMVAAWGGKLLVVVAPDKSSIYPEFLPTLLAESIGPRRIDQFNARLAAENIDVLDLRGPLLAAKTQGLLFSKRDTHWSGLGVVVATQQIAQHIARLTGKNIVVDESMFALLPRPHHGDLAKLMALPSWVRDTVMTPVAKSSVVRKVARDPARVAAGQFVFADGAVMFESEQTDAPSVLVQHDSFGLPLQATLPHVLGNSTWLYWTGSFAGQAIARDKPAVVVYLTAERYLHRQPPQ